MDPLLNIQYRSTVTLLLIHTCVNLYYVHKNMHEPTYTNYDWRIVMESAEQTDGP